MQLIMITPEANSPTSSIIKMLGSFSFIKGNHGKGFFLSALSNSTTALFCGIVKRKSNARINPRRACSIQSAVLRTMIKEMLSRHGLEKVKFAFG
jgi:hypothetical protein